MKYCLGVSSQPTNHFKRYNNKYHLSLACFITFTSFNDYCRSVTMILYSSLIFCIHAIKQHDVKVSKQSLVYSFPRHGLGFLSLVLGTRRFLQKVKCLNHDFFPRHGLSVAVHWLPRICTNFVCCFSKLLHDNHFTFYISLIDH